MVANSVDPRRGVATFLGLTFGASWALEIGCFFAPLPAAERLAICALLAMFVPAAAAWLMRGPLGHEGFADAGLAIRWRQSWRVYVAAYVAVPLLVFAGLGVALVSGVQHWVYPPQFVLDGVTKRIPAAAGGLMAAAALSVALPINMVFAFGEEFGWRGYLLPRFAALGRARGAALAGCVWGLWHAPLIALYGFNYPGHPLAGVATMVLFATAFGLLQGWLRYASGSVWPCVLAHAALNAQAGFGLIFLTPADSLLRAPVGLCGAAPFVALAVWLVATKRFDRERVGRSLKPALPRAVHAGDAHF